MKRTLIIILFTMALSASAQVINKKFNQEKNKDLFNYQNEIVATPTTISIIVKVIYNAIPDGYHVTYTTSLICRSIAEIENRMDKKIDSMVAKAADLKITKRDILVDVISMDPIFDFNQADTIPPIGYKVTENLTFNVKEIPTILKLSRLCMEFGIYDLIDAKAYIKNSKRINDTLADKTVEVLEMKKKLCSDIGWDFSGGRVSLTKFNEVLYPSERYLSSYISNSTLFTHHVSQNSNIKLERTVNVDDYYNLDLKNADYVFNADYTNPVVQFYYQLNYIYTKVDTEEEMRTKIRQELEEKQEKTIYIIDKKGNLKKVDR